MCRRFRLIQISAIADSETAHSAASTPAKFLLLQITVVDVGTVPYHLSLLSTPAKFLLLQIGETSFANNTGKYRQNSGNPRVPPNPHKTHIL